jgi:O-antigen ligase
MMDDHMEPMRGIIIWTMVICVGGAMLPWFSGGQEPIAMLVSAGALLLGGLLAWRQPQVRAFKMGPLAISYLLFMAFAFLSLVWSVNRYSTGVWLTEWLTAGLAFRLAYIVAGEKDGRERLLRIYLITALLFCVAAVWLYMTSSYDRLTGLFYWPNPAAAYLIPAILIAIDRMRISVGKQVLIWGALASVFIACFMLTDSRAAFIVLVFVALMYFVIVVMNRAMWMRLGAVLVAGLFISYGLVFLSTITVQHSSKIAPGSRLTQVAAGQSESLSDRLNYIESALMIWNAHPILGTGAGTYGAVHPQYQRRVISASVDAHNEYAQLLSELGLVGILLFLWLLLWLLAGTFRGLVKEPQLVALGIGAVGLLLHFGLDIDASYPALLILLAVILGMIYRQSHLTRKSLSWKLPFVAALLLVPTASLYKSEAWAARAAASQQEGNYSQAAALYSEAHTGVLYNPTYIDAEGINDYTVALTGGTQSKVALALALDRARMAERLAPVDGQNYQLEGRVLWVQGKVGAAESAFRRALVLDPYDHPEYALDLASAEVLANNPLQAITTAQDMINLYPDDVVTNRLGDVTLKPALGNLEALIGNIDYRLGRYADARSAASKSTRYDPSNLGGRALSNALNKRSA